MKVGSAMEKMRGAALPRDARQRGTVAVMFAVMVVIILAFFGLALDVSQVYNRKIELQVVADAAALAAARELDGTAAGVARAIARASAAIDPNRYRYYQESFHWSDSVLTFSSSPKAADGDWVDATQAAAAPGDMLYARADTRFLDDASGEVDTLFMGAVSASRRVAVSARAIAGRTMSRVTPLAICALSPQPASPRVNPGPPVMVELEEFGFRRGVAYDLTQLNPAGTSGVTFALDPISPLGSFGPASNTSPAVLAPFVCSGRIPMPRVTGRQIAVRSPFPLDALYFHLNTRFDQYAGTGCTNGGAPPDRNVRPYTYASVDWHWASTGKPAMQTAQSLITNGKLWTIASPLPAPSTNTAGMYGPLWSFAMAVPWSSYVPGAAEPAAGYTSFPSSGSWGTLYKPGAPGAGAAPTPYFYGRLGFADYAPYFSTAGSWFLAPAVARRPGLSRRRVLNIPLLACPVPPGSAMATVLGIGKFFMTVPATANSIAGEFAGAVTDQQLGGPVELFP